MILILTYQQQTAFENIVGKEEIARNKQFLLFPQCFLLNQKIEFLFVNIFDIISLFTAEMEEPKIGMWGKGLKSLLTKEEILHTGNSIFSFTLNVLYTLEVIFFFFLSLQVLWKFYKELKAKVASRETNLAKMFACELLHLALINLSPPDKILDWKAYADDKLNLAKMIQFVPNRFRKHSGKKTKCWPPEFDPFPHCFLKPFP